MKKSKLKFCECLPDTHKIVKPVRLAPPLEHLFYCGACKQISKPEWVRKEENANRT